MSNGDQIATISQLIDRVKSDTVGWSRSGSVKPWFRGQTCSKYELLPSVLRSGNEKSEFEITTRFRLLAPGYGTVPETNRIDQWLFLMQHHGVPTRLLDWTENLLYAALFATAKGLIPKKEINNDATIYCLDPFALNHLSGLNGFPNTWAAGPVLQTIKFAFGTQDDHSDGTCAGFLEFPVAVYPSTIHSRIKTQRGCFTLHGNDKRPFERNVGPDLTRAGRLLKYIIPKAAVRGILEELYDAGITYGGLFQDLDGLGCDLKYQFKLSDC